MKNKDNTKESDEVKEYCSKTLEQRLQEIKEETITNIKAIYDSNRVV